MAAATKTTDSAPKAGDKPAEKVRRKVRATRTGYYEHTIRNVGDVFIQDDAISPFSKTWMEVVSDTEPERITGSNAIIQQEHDAIVRQKMNLGSGDTTASTASTGDTKVIGD